MSEEEIKNEFINCIEGTHTLNLAISVLEDREDYKKEIERLQRQKEELQINGLRQETLFKLEIERLQNIIKEIREYLDKNEIEEVYLDCKLYETKVYKDILEILDKGSDEISK